tara:strand:+ start:3282 stop:3569 length:288 start_codon:yes stop_codon:yes gene_type:complete
MKEKKEYQLNLTQTEMNMIRFVFDHVKGLDVLNGEDLNPTEFYTKRIAGSKSSTKDFENARLKVKQAHLDSFEPSKKRGRLPSRFPNWNGTYTQN